MTSENPLLRQTRLPAFDSIGPEHIKPAIMSVLAENRKLVAQVTGDKSNADTPGWDSLMFPLEEAEDRLSKVWSTVSHLNAVMNTPEIRAAYNECQPMVTEYYTELGQNRALFECVQSLQQRQEALGLDASQRKIISDRLLDFRLAGVALEETDKKRFATLESRLAELSTRFSNNVLDATMAWQRQVTEVEELAGLSPQALESAAALARRKNLEGYVLSLDLPCYLAVMTTADKQALRKEMYDAFNTRASEFDSSDGKWDNCAIIDEILCCRAELASLLDFESYAAMSVVRKMAASPQRVMEFLDDLIDSSHPAAAREFAELEEFARSEYGQQCVNPWDVAYYSEKQRQKNFDLSQEALRVYFPSDRVKQGLFDVVKRLYGIDMVRNEAVETWHDQVEFFDLYRKGELIAQCYLDLFTREGKRSGAWMADCRGRRKLEDGSWQLPVAYLTCNFTPPGEKTPSLLTHNEVTTLFHEFGHGLHHMLTREGYLFCSGINGVAWDAVELPSQLMENWCWDSEGIAMISGHYQTGEPLPRDILQRLLAARNFQAGMRSVRQLEFALFDFRLHHEATVESIKAGKPGAFVSRILGEARARTQVFPVPESNRFQNGFSHIFAGGYAAGYYSYKWAEVLSADVFSRFSETGVFNQETGAAFLDKILSRGGSADALALFVDFMGREPDPAALLRQEGLVSALTQGQPA